MLDKGWTVLCCNSFLLTAMTLTIIRVQTMPQNGDVRLVNINDSTNMTGRLEVYYNGQWGTVCDDYFDTNAATVVCRQLGFNPDGALVVVRAGFGQGTGNISLDDIFCFRSEQTINSCSHNGWGTHNCNHSEDVGIICLSPNATQLPIQVRLVDGADEHEGRVEILYAGLWGGICLGFRFDLGSANVICRQLGYPGAVRVAQYLEFGAGSGQIWLTELSCTGTENSLEQCPHDGFGIGECYFLGDDVGIECMEITPPPQFSVRLIGGSTEYEGRVEFYYNGQWGTVCNDSWDINDAEVVCRQLHFNGANETLGSAQFGTGTGPIWLDDVWCNGSEQELSECPHSSNNSFGNHNCNHQQDAGVRCTDILCDNLQSPANGQIALCSSSIIGAGYEGDTCSFTCNSGYELTGNDTRTCESDGRWSGADIFIMCSRVRCPSLTNPDNGVANCSLGDDGIPSYEDTCSFTCNSSYEITGSDTRTCQGDESWSGTPATCSRLDDTNGSGSSSSSVAIIGGGIILLVLVTVSVVYTV